MFVVLALSEQASTSSSTSSSSSSASNQERLGGGKQQRLMSSSGQAEPLQQQGGGRNFNQLFSGASSASAGNGIGGLNVVVGPTEDSRFVINGSSLQIRSPSKRHDEAIYFCRHINVRQAAPTQDSGQQEAVASVLQQQASKLVLADLQQPQQAGVHQSSLATSSSATCSSAPLASSLFSGADSDRYRYGHRDRNRDRDRDGNEIEIENGIGIGGKQQTTTSSLISQEGPLSSISIRIVGK